MNNKTVNKTNPADIDNNKILKYFRRRECPICGKFFIPKYKLQRVCNACQNKDIFKL